MIRVNGRDYRLAHQPTVVVCIDACTPADLARAVARGDTPWLEQVFATGTVLTAGCAETDLAQPAGLSVAAGMAPAWHEVATPHRTAIVLAALADAGQFVAVVTAREELRTLLGRGSNGISFSAEHADRATEQENGIDDVVERVGMPVPAPGSPGIAEFVFAAGVALMSHERRPDVLYLSTADAARHDHASGHSGADTLLRMMDGYLGRLDSMDCVVVLTAGRPLGTPGSEPVPDTLYLQDLLDDWLGADVARVILPIDEPDGAHHAPLGAHARIVLPDGVDPDAISRRLRAVAGVDAVRSRAEAAAFFEAPAGRAGELVVVAAPSVRIGACAPPSGLPFDGSRGRGPGHGPARAGEVPLLVNRHLRGMGHARHWRNVDAFDLALNHVD